MVIFRVPTCKFSIICALLSRGKPPSRSSLVSSHLHLVYPGPHRFGGMLFGDNLSCWGWSLVTWWGLRCSGFGGSLSPLFIGGKPPNSLGWYMFFFFQMGWVNHQLPVVFSMHYICWRILWIIFGGKSINGRYLKLEIWTIKTYPTQTKTPVVPWFASDWLAKLPRRHSRSWRFWKWKKTSSNYLDMQIHGICLVFHWLILKNNMLMLSGWNYLLNMVHWMGSDP